MNGVFLRRAGVTRNSPTNQESQKRRACHDSLVARLQGGIEASFGPNPVPACAVKERLINGFGCADDDGFGSLCGAKNGLLEVESLGSGPLFSAVWRSLARLVHHCHSKLFSDQGKGVAERKQREELSTVLGKPPVAESFTGPNWRLMTRKVWLLELGPWTISDHPIDLSRRMASSLPPLGALRMTPQTLPRAF